MGRKDLIDWAIERRLDMLSEKKRLPQQEETIADIEKALSDGKKPGFHKKMGEILDGIRWSEKDIYREGFKDGIRLAKRLGIL